MPVSSAPHGSNLSSTATDSGGYVAFADSLRVAGALAVVFIHVTGDGSSAIDTLSRKSWLFCLTIEALCRWAVPIFVMLSGLLLLDPKRDESPGLFYKKRLSRIAIPMVFWSLFYLAWSHFYEGQRFALTTALYRMVAGSAYYHLWFLTMLLGLYLSAPLVRIIVRGLSSRQLWIATLVILGLGMTDAVVRANQASDFTFIFKFTPFIGLFLLGYCLKSVRWKKDMVWIGAAAWILGAIISVASTYILAFYCKTSGWDIDDRLFLMEDEFSPGPLISSVGIFTLFAAFHETRGITKASPLITSLSAASLGIYLTHPIFLSILNAHDIDYEWHGILFGVFSNVAIAFCCASILSLMLLRLPILKRTI